MDTAFSEMVRSSDTPIMAPSADELDRVLADLTEAAEDLPEFAVFLDQPSAAREFLLSALSLSPYLFDIATCHPDCAWRALSSEPETLLDQLIIEAGVSWKEPDDGEAGFMKRMRQLKRMAAFSLALYDLSKVLETRQVTARLSAFAAAALSSAIDFLLMDAHNAGKLKLPDTDNPSSGSGLAVIGMGKLGAGELNYSSDIDLIVIYDPDKAVVIDESATADVFARIIRRVVHIMQERTGDGYVFRTDLRLRPDPGSTPLAIPYDAAMIYYEGRGQNWERAAFIKARAVAGDLQTGDGFCRDLTPFIFRKYLDYGAIAEIHSIKRQIHAHKGFGDITIRGHNVKLGRGGIREIEFFVQTQQLIAGGRMPELRTRETEIALARLAEARWIGTETAKSMLESYWFLRDLEHRIQMRRDEQSHTLPDDDEELRKLALMMGFADTEGFSATLSATLQQVERHYAALFENEKETLSDTGELVFSGDEDDPATLETLSKLGFDRAADVSRIIRTWYYGRYRATQTAAARKNLAELMPHLLRTFSETRRADETFLRFDAFLSGLPSGIQLFSLLRNNPGLLSLIVNVMSSAPRLAEVISRRPHVFDGMLDPTLLAELPTRAYLAKRLDEFLIGDFLYEEILDRLRIFASEQKFLIGVRLLTGSISGARAGRAFSDLAGVIVGVAARAVQTELERAHGPIEGGRVAIVGMGKLGSREMTAESDIDIILLYAHDEDCMESAGPKPLDPPRYYARFTQRLVAALSAPTAEGVLYEVDLRLRPSGNKGPVATNIRAFRKYQAEGAWTWEHMALTRARIVSGDASLAEEAEEIFSEVLDRPRDRDQIANDIAQMRQRIATEKPPDNLWDLKLVPGGIIDIEFIAQYLRLLASTCEVDAETVGTRTRDVLGVLAPRMINEADAESLLEALSLFTEISQVIRLCLETRFEPEDAPLAFRELLLKICDCSDLKALEARLEQATQTVRRIFVDTIGGVDDAGPVS
ncbi:MAG: bifunctional [glutamine synthetase] adenylyltransferase/[glutamine synthetase]-adenylyl-L-tyrosine phosphorylase [Alphaproteobacteria bacterium]|nr:bifunctional [glutamine synthetase] adenylyltransferase/[glutamine synthetase]-adenylyl-L-tyrosine phosphorylase [Alphaproteobacteria bacterium]